MKRFIQRFIFAWHFAYDTKKWRSFSEHYKVPKETNNVGKKDESE